MRLVLAAGEGLNAVSCDRLLRGLAVVWDRQAPEVIIDLHGAAFVDPYGACCLALVVQQTAARGQRVALVLPSQERVQRSLADLGALQYLATLAEMRNRLPGGRSQPSGDGLPLSRVGSRADVQQVLAYLVEQAKRRLGYATGDVLDATKVVSELCYNVVDHSGTQGLAAAEIYQDRNGRRFVALAVVDDGQGIRASLAGRHPEASGWRHGVAIERALGGLSSREQGGGAGLRSIHDVVRRYNGRLSIRSGSDRLFVAAERQPRMLSGVTLGGTQVGISFSQRP